MTPDPDRHKKRIFIIDDHPLVREWLAAWINQQSDLKVCGEAGDASEALELIGPAKPHVAVVDISMRGLSGIDLIKSIRTLLPEMRILVLSVHDEGLYRDRAIRAGASGYVMKRETTTNVLQAIRRVLKGELYLTEKVAEAEAGKPARKRPPPEAPLVESLSNRELEVFQLLGRGCSTRQIAEQLNISFRTVQSFNARIKEKLKLASAAELLREAVRWQDGQDGKQLRLG